MYICMSTRFFEYQPNEICSLLKEKASKGTFLNPLSPKSDQHEFSLYNINALENRVVMRLEYMIREDVSN